ncbi:MAG: DNA gyrase subunit A [Clostridiaceae bacterium]|nr:DNA gyrase subunit A [Clostridiaceae bacterium]
MAKKQPPSHRADTAAPAVIVEQPITETIVNNFMPYAMSVILSRAIPEIDGLKPSHRKLLYTMYKMGLLGGSLTKSANIVGQTMRLNPHGDAAIYETMVRLSRGNGALLHPLIESKGNFGRVYSRDMAYAAARYTEARLDGICAEFFRDIDCDAVDFVPNYDNTMREPTLMPTTFPHILVTPNQGIAVGMASMICSFNLAEVCTTTAAMIKNPAHDVLSTLIAPDFSTGGLLLYDRDELLRIYQTGRGTFRVRAKWRADGNIIEITELPYTTTVEAVMDKCAEMIKTGKLKEVSDIRDETDLSGLKLAIDLKRGQDPGRLMQKLFKTTPLEDTFGCNFNVLIAGNPRVLGVGEILTEWIAWRTECVKRRVFYDMTKKKERLHLLLGLEKILLDIDRAIAIIRGTEREEDVIPNLMVGFGIDEAQAEYVAEIRLRNINRAYILGRVAETEALMKEIDELEATVKSKTKLQAIILKELAAVSKKFGQPRRTMLLEPSEIEEIPEEENDYPVTVFLTREGYFKKITPQSLRMSGEQKVKEGDNLRWSAETRSSAEIIFLTDRAQAYKATLAEFEDCKASVLGDFIPQKLGMDDGERPVLAFLPGDYLGSLLFVFENGKAARVPMKSYETKSNRRRLTGAYSTASPLIAAFAFTEDTEFALYATNGKLLLLHTAMLAPKASRDTQGISVMTFAAKYRLERALTFADAHLQNPKRYRVKTLPAAGMAAKPEDSGQVVMDENP